MHGLLEAPSQVPHVLSRRTLLQRRTQSYRHDLTRELQLIGFNTDRAAVQLRVSLSLGAAAQDREKWHKLAARLPLVPVTVENPSLNKRGRNGLSLSMLSRRPI
jgi:hypothetical protein